MTPTTFSIVLSEGDDGIVTITASAAGTGIRTYELGIEIMANLKAAEIIYPERLKVMQFEYSDHWH
jgi:hypothetical protein